MCGLTGIILGNSPRNSEDYEWLKESFTASLLANEVRGPHATGIVLIRRDGTYSLFKRPVSARQFICLEEYQDILAELDDNVTILMGHTRYRTIGSEFKANNNHPIRAGKIIGTHNGTIYNAGQIAKVHGLLRYADVDSEVLFRMANHYRVPAHFESKLKVFKGQLTAIMVNLNKPDRIRIYKGNKPLSIRLVSDLDMLIYTSDSSHFKAVDFRDTPYQESFYKPNRVITIDVSSSIKRKVASFVFVSERRKNW